MESELKFFETSIFFSFSAFLFPALNIIASLTNLLVFLNSNATTEVLYVLS